MLGQNTIVVIYATPLALNRAFSDFQSCADEVTFSVLARSDTGERILHEPAPHWPATQEWACVAIRGLGQVLATGPIAGLLLAVMDNAAIFGQLSALAACLHSMGIEKERIPECEAAVQSGACLLFVHGSADQVGKLREMLNRSRLPDPSLFR